MKKKIDTEKVNKFLNGLGIHVKKVETLEDLQESNNFSGLFRNLKKVQIEFKKR